MKKAKKPLVKVARKSAGRSVRRGATADPVHAHGDGIDGCDVDFNEIETTPDHALPAAAGGVAGVGRSRRQRASI